MWFLKKKKISEEETVTNKLELTNEQKIIKVLKNTTERSIIKDDALYIEDIKLKIEAHVQNVNEKVIQVVFVLSNEKFDEEFTEFVVGMGNTIDEMIQQAVATFSFSALCAITKALRDEEAIHIESPFYNITKKFKMYKSCISAQGEKISGDSMDFWDMLGEEIKKRLGNKRVYWIKIYVGKTRNSVNCECRINGIVNNEITKIIAEFAGKWEISTFLYSERQFFVLVQDESTYVPYKFSKEQINDFVDKTVESYGKCDTHENYENIIDDIDNITEDMNLTTELYLFLPEIFCEFVCHEVNFQDDFILLQGDKKITMYKDQITSYNWIYDKIGNKFGNNQLTQEQVRNIVTCSASLNVINNALNNGSKIGDLCMTSLAYNVGDSYRPY